MFEDMFLLRKEKKIREKNQGGSHENGARRIAAVLFKEEDICTFDTMGNCSTINVLPFHLSLFTNTG